MTTSFRFEHTFRAPSPETVFRAYFNPDHLAAQDKVAELTGREVVEEREDDAVKVMAWKVTSQKPLPLFARAFVDGGRLSYKEAMTWRKADGEIDLVITPQILNGRVQLTAVYKLTPVGENQVKRTYSGNVSVDIRLVGGKIERAVVQQIEDGIPLMFQCTQDWLATQA